MKINVLKIGYSIEEAHAALQKRKGNFTIVKTDLLYYPYLKIIYTVKGSAFVKRYNGHVVCTVDMANGRESMATSHGDIEEIEADDILVMPVTQDREKVLKNASLFVGTEVIKKVKVLSIPNIEYVHDEIFYKPFYIIECKNIEAESFYLMFDTITAEFTVLVT